MAPALPAGGAKPGLSTTAARRLQASCVARTKTCRRLPAPPHASSSKQEAAAGAVPVAPAAGAAAPASQQTHPGVAAVQPKLAAKSQQPIAASALSAARQRHGSRAAAPPPTDAAPPAAPEGLETPAVVTATGAATAAERLQSFTASLSSETWGKLCLLVVALLWGSYAPFLRLLYSQDGPPEPAAIMLFRGVLQAFVLVTAYSLFGSKGGSSSDGVGVASSGGDSPTITTASSGSDASKPLLVAAALAGGEQASPAQQAAVGQQSSLTMVPAWVQRISSRISFTGIAATELGLWLFMATAIQTLGLQLTTATRAGFLIQATTLLTPVLASFTGQKPSRNVWLGCVVALAGCLFIASDASATDSDDGALFSLGGDAAILSSAFFYSLATVRLGTYARYIPAVELAAGKSVMLGSAAVGTFAMAAASMAAQGYPITDLWPGYTNPLAWSILIYSALGPGALAAFLHAKGQSVVPPAEAQVIFSTVPLWSVAFAFLLLGGEPMSEKTWIGGAAVVAAGLIASRKSEPAVVATGEDTADKAGSR